jgi:hypothetical protein
MHRGLVLSSDVKSSRAPWEALFPERRIQTPALSDPVWQFVPWLRLARRELAEGRLPLWNPHQDGGVPLLGNSISALGSPLNWPVLLFDVDPGWNVSLLLRLLLAAAAAFAFLRDLRRSRAASALGAVAFALSGAFVAWLEHPLTLAAAPAPLLFLFARRAARAASPGSIAGLALSTFLVLSGGHPETSLMVALLAAGVVAAAGSGSRRWLPPAAGAALGAGLAAPLLLPFLEYFRLSAARAGEGRRPFVLAARDLLRFLAPRLPDSNVVEAAATVSLAVLLLLPFGLRAARRDGETRFWAVAAAVMLLAVYDNPLSRGLAAATPVYWTRLLLLLPVALAAVASSGLDALRGAVAARGRPALARGLAAAAVAAAAVELLSAARGVHGVTPASLVAPETPLLSRLAEDRDDFRVLPLHTFLPPNSATDYRLDDVRGYDALGPAGWRRERAAIGRFVDLPSQRDAVEPWELVAGGAALDDWNVKYLLLPPQFGFGAETLNARKGLDLEEVYAGPDGRILRNRRAGPRVRVARGQARILERAPGLWRIEARAESSGRVRVADPFFPGWRARVDGTSAPIAAAPGEAIEVNVAPGRHLLELSYRPASWRLGIAIGLAAAAAVALLLRRARAGARASRAAAAA